MEIKWLWWKFLNWVLTLNFEFSSKPLQIWEKQVRNGHIKRVTDPDIQSSVIEIMGTNVSTNYITCPLDAKQTLTIKLPFLVMIIKNVSERPTLTDIRYSWKNISLSKSKYSMTRTWEEDSEPLTIRVPHVSSLSFAPCPWDSMKDGIKFSSTCLISPDVPTVPTTLKPWGT